MNTKTVIQKLFPLCALLFLVPNSNLAQYRITSKEKIEGFKSMPRETVFVHYNDAVLLVGEYLYYKLYCLQGNNLKPSPISKIAYVELVGKDKNLVFRHKIPLTSGMGQGDFFIPTTIPSGNYKLVGYTQWMFNGDSQDFFTVDITILNPYQALPEVASANREIRRPPIETINSLGNLNASSTHREPPFLKIELEKKHYGQRELVAAKISTISNTPVQGNFSISVRKKYLEIPKSKITATQYSLNTVKRNIPYTITSDTVFLPELRGELISGRVVTKANNSPVVGNKKVSLSFFGNSPLVYIANTDAKGIFYCNLAPFNRSNLATLQVLEDDKNQWDVVLDSFPNPSYEHLNFKEFSISSDVNPIIRQRSIYNQIENAYFEQKADSTVVVNSKLPAYLELEETYILDDYERFPTLKETVVEIISGVQLRKVKGEYKFLIRSEDNFLLDSNDTSLVLVDGVLFQDLSSLTMYTAKGIERIGISRGDHYIGPQLYKGVVSIKTKENDFLSKTNLADIKQVKIATPIALKKYFFRDYSNDHKTKRVPDYRSQLLWKPDLEMKKSETMVHFYTSNNVGEYEISLEGFNQEGKPISLLETIFIE